MLAYKNNEILIYGPFAPQNYFPRHFGCISAHKRWVFRFHFDTSSSFFAPAVPIGAAVPLACQHLAWELQVWVVQMMLIMRLYMI